MKILVTGSDGFIGKNLTAALRSRGCDELLLFDKKSDPVRLAEYAAQCDFVCHLAGVNRAQEENEFEEGNTRLTVALLGELKKRQSPPPLLFTSSIQAALDSPYGSSKRACEQLIFSYARETGARVYVYRLPNLFGKWCRPNYNSVVATFCHNLTHGLELTINEPEKLLTLAYIDDAVAEFIAAIGGHERRLGGGYCEISPVYELSVMELAEKLRAFAANSTTLVMPTLGTPLDRALYATLISALPEGALRYPLDCKGDSRGWLSEFIKSETFGQIFISRTEPGITRGNHWHQTKTEKFLVLEGEAVISLRRVGGESKTELRVTGEAPEAVDIPPGMVHAITNTGKGCLVTLFWSDELFDPEKPDTFYEPV